MNLSAERIQNSILRLTQVARRWNGVLTISVLIVAFVLLALGSNLGVALALAVIALLQLHQSSQISIAFDRQNQLESQQANQSGYVPTTATPAPGISAPTVPAGIEKLLRSSTELVENVTIVVPLFNEERFIFDCLESIRQQTWRSWECIVVDDASTDTSAEIVGRFIAQDNRFKLVRHQVNSGLSASRNTGLRLATTSYVTFLDSDDMLLKHSLQMRMSMLRALPDDEAMAGVYCGIVQVPEETDHNYVPKNLKAAQTTADFVNSQAECPFNAHAPIIRTDILRSLGGFDESMKNGAEDWDLWQRVMRSGFFFRSVPKVGGLYRRKRQSMVRTLSLEHIREAERLYENAQHEFIPATHVASARVFDQPGSTYATTLSFVRRLIPFASMAFVHSGEAGLDAVLQRLPKDSGRYLLRHLNASSLASAGVLRAFAVDESGKEQFQAEHDAVVQRVVGELENRLDALDEAYNPDRISPPNYQFVFYVTDAYEARQAQQIASHTDLPVAFLTADTANGLQGASAAISNDYPMFSVNEFVMAHCQVQNFVAFKSYGFGIADIAAFAERSGARLIFAKPEISIEPTDDTLPPPPSFDATASVADLGEQLAGFVQTDPTDQRPTRTDLFVYATEVSALEESVRDVADVEKLRSFKDKHKGERCVIVGNGPSLNEMDLRPLANEISFAVNGIFYKTEEMGFSPTYYVVEDSSVMKENIEAIRAYDPPFKFVPTIYRSLHPSDDNVSFFKMNRGFYEKSGPNFCVPRFSTDASQRVYCGQSVTFINLQLAYYMGFSEVVLIGMDFSYVIPDSAIRDGDLITSTEDDPNHFNGAYFGKGKTWKDPKLDRVLQNYMMAKRIYEADGRRIINATHGGRLEAFDRVDFTSLVKEPVSAS